MQQAQHPLPLDNDSLHPFQQGGPVLQGGQQRNFGGQVDIVGGFHSHHGKGQVRVHCAQANPQPGQAGPFAESPQHHQVGILFQQRQSGLSAELVVGFIHYHYLAGVQQGADFVRGRRIAGGIVGGGQKDGFGAAIDRRQYARPINIKVGVAGDGADFAAANFGGKGVHSKGGRGDDDVFPRPQEHPQQHINQFIAAVAGYDALRGHAQIVGQGGPQLPLIRVGIVVVVPKAAQGFRYPGRRAVGIFIPVKADDLFRGNSGPLGQHFHRVDAVIGFHPADVGQQQVFNFGHCLTQGGWAGYAG